MPGAGAGGPVFKEDRGSAGEDEEVLETVVVVAVPQQVSARKVTEPNT